MFEIMLLTPLLAAKAKATSYQLIEPLSNQPITPFPNSSFLLALVGGVVMAFAFQLLFTNLLIARVASPDDFDHDPNSDSLGDTISGIETKLGVGLLISVSLSLFVGTFLAIKLSLINNPTLGAITGVIIWSIFFTLLTWLGSTALGSLLGSIISSATAGIQGLMNTGSAVLGANFAKNKVVSTAEEITAAVRRELTAGFDADSIQTTLQNSLDKVKLPSFNSDQLKNQFEKFFKDADLGAIADSDLLKNINRDTLVKLVSSRTDLSKKDINRIADQLESAWKTVTDSKEQLDPQELVKALKSAAPKDLQSGKLNEQLNQIVKTASSKLTNGDTLTSRALQFGTTAVLSKVLQNVDLSDLDVEKIGDQLRTAGSNLLQPNGNTNGQSSKEKSKPFSVIQADLENYLLLSPPWKLNRETVKQDFRDVIYDEAADPGILGQELKKIDRNYFVQVLSLRDDFKPEAIQDLAGYLEEIRNDVFNTVQTTAKQGKAQGLRDRIENYLRSTDKEALNPDGIEQNFKTLLEDPEASMEDLNDRLSHFDQNSLQQLLSQRQDISEEEASQIANQLEQTRHQVLSQAQNLQDSIQSQAQQLRHQVSDYLRNTNKEELNPEGIQRDLKTLFEDPESGLNALRGRLSQFDRDTLVQLLSERQDLSEEQVNQVLDQIESIRDNLLQAPKKLAGKAKEQYEQTTQALSDYLRNTNLEELDPEGIQNDLSTLFSEPKAGVTALQERLSHIDRETLVKLLSQREDLTEEQVNQAIDKIQSSIRNLVKAPRRLANRVQKQATDFEANLETYLRNTNKEELNPDGIKRDLQLLLQDPRAGLSSLGDRLSQFDRETFVKLLSQREDLTEEEANHIADQVESTFKGIVEQFQKVQQKVQAAIDKGFDNIRGYLNGLERPELNYDSLKEDFEKLFNDPQLGLESLRDRLTHFDRDTLVALLSSREDISEEDANRVLDQIQGVRDNVFHQVEQIQQETQKRIEKIKYEAQEQVRETRKVASGAAWWVFSSALSSLAAAAIAGFLAVTQFPTS